MTRQIAIFLSIAALFFYHWAIGPSVFYPLRVFLALLFSWYAVLTAYVFGIIWVLVVRDESRFKNQLMLTIANFFFSMLLLFTEFALSSIITRWVYAQMDAQGIVTSASAQVLYFVTYACLFAIPMFWFYRKPDETSPKGGIPKWVIIVIIAVAILYALFYVGGMLIGNAFKAKTGLQNMQMSPDGKSFAIQGKDGEMVQVGENVKLPPGFPSSMPIYPGAKIQSAINAKDGFSVSYLVENTQHAVVQAWYIDELAKKGWENEMEKMGQGSGTFPVKNGDYAGIVLVMGKDNITSVTINIGKDTE